MARRAIALFLLALPLLAGLALAGPALSPNTADPARVRVALVSLDPHAMPDAASSQLIAGISESGEFDWHVQDVDSAGRALAEGSATAAVVVPTGFGATTAGSDNTVTITSNRADLDADTYARLVNVVSAAATTTGLGDLLIGVSSARTNLSAAQFTANLVTAASDQADTMLTDAFTSVDGLLINAGPLLTDTKTMLPSLRQLSTTLAQTLSTLQASATALQAVDLTVGDVRQAAAALGRGADDAGNTLQETAAIRHHTATTLQPVADLLRSSGLPQGKQLADQMMSLIDLLGGDSDEIAAAGLQGLDIGVGAVSTLLGQLSGLLGAEVGENTRLADVMTLAVGRLQLMERYLSQGEQLLTEFEATAGRLPAMQAQFRDLLTRFQGITAQLDRSVDAASSALPAANSVTTGEVALDPLSDRGQDPLTSRAVVILCVGAALIVVCAGLLAERWIDSGRTRRRVGLGTGVVAVFLGTAMIAIGMAVLRPVSHTGSTVAVLILVAVVLTTLCYALVRICGFHAGITGWLLLMAAGIAWTGGVDGGYGTLGDAIRRLLPTGYAVTGVDQATASGLAGSAIFPLAVLAGLGIASLIALRVSRTPPRPGITAVSTTATGPS